MVDRRLFSHFDWTLLLLAAAIAALGLATLYAATHHLGQTEGTPLYVKQLYWLGLGLVALAVMVVIDYHFFEEYGYLIFLASLALLAAVLVMGRSAGGSQRWIAVGPLNLQPSEAAKLALIITLAKYFHNHEAPGGYRLVDLLAPLVIVGAPMALILKQPDLGTALVLALIFASMLVLVRLRASTWISLFVAAALSFPIGWSVLKPYQRNRILTLLNPDADPLGTGYHIRQSLIAVGSGKSFGKGYLQGTQSHLRFLPEQHTDFIFSVFAEEWGFVGAALLIALYGALILWGLRVAWLAKDRFGSFCAAGVVAFVFWHVFINIGMVTGILPVVGMPLPLFSYGGTSVLVFMSALGLLINVSMRRHRR
ncbi:MAG: rod shape-determining protein RodA [Myxococcales bacterium]|nr:rod shape-determining protein RodA [Myxococcales bacterium]